MNLEVVLTDGAGETFRIQSEMSYQEWKDTLTTSELNMDKEKTQIINAMVASICVKKWKAYNLLKKEYKVLLILTTIVCSLSLLQSIARAL